MEHTKEPWVVGKSQQFGVEHISVDETCAFAPRSLALTGVVGDRDEEESIANARRIVACVNACAGVPIEQLELDKVYFIEMLKERNTLKQQRDELLAAAQEVRLFVQGELPTLGYLRDNDKSRAALEKLRIAIAKATA